MTVVGSCDDACADEGPYRQLRRIAATRGGRGAARIYHESITVFLPKSGRGDRQGRSGPVSARSAEAGSGGMGTVYRARDLTDGATVAVKILNGPRAARGGALRAGGVDPVAGSTHPAIVRYLAHGIADIGRALHRDGVAGGRGPGDAARAQAGHASPRRWRWRGGRPRRWRTRTSAASSTATSSPRTCSCPGGDRAPQGARLRHRAADARRRAS